MSLVSITQSGSQLRLRRYARAGRALTHDGTYDPLGCTPCALEGYRQFGARQDQLRQALPLRGVGGQVTRSA